VADRWHELENAVADTRLTASDKAVYNRRLKCSRYGTAEPVPRFTETQAEVAAKISLTVRQVRRAERHLELHGWLKISGSGGRGRKPDYEVRLGVDCDCTGRVHTPLGVRLSGPQADTIGGHAAGQMPVSARSIRGYVGLTCTTDNRGDEPETGTGDRTDCQAGGADAIGGHAAGQKPVSADVSTDPGPGPEAPRAGDL
jgi:hypothetical protein